MAPTHDESAGASVDPRVVRTRHDILGTALRMVVDEGPEALTHQHIAQVAGYSKATLYKHWASRAHLLRDAFDAFAALDEMPHHVPTGDIRADLVGEMRTFRWAIEQHRLDRMLAALIGLTASHPELEATRDLIVTEGEHVMRAVLGRVLAGARLDAAVHMLVGSVINAALLHGTVPTDDVISACVDLVLDGVDRY